MMHVLSSLIDYIKLRRVYSKQKRQKRTVLHMLAASGVVRPSILNSVTRNHSPDLPLAAHNQLRSSMRSLAPLSSNFRKTARTSVNQTDRRVSLCCFPSRVFLDTTSRIACTSHMAWGKITARLLVFLRSSPALQMIGNPA